MVEVLPNVTIRTGGETRKYKNMMIQQGLDWLMDLAAGLTPGAISYIAVGTDGTAVTLGDLTLKAEAARKQVSTVARDNGAAVAEVFFDKAEANVYWKEIGLFVGGTEAANSGKLIARALVDEAKDDKRTATVTWEIGIRNA